MRIESLVNSKGNTMLHSAIEFIQSGGGLSIAGLLALIFGGAAFVGSRGKSG